MATSNEKKDATSVAVAIIGIIGTLLGIVYFILASGNKEFNTLRLIEIVGLTLTSMGIVLVGSIANNSKDTFSFPYLFGMLTYLLFAYDYMNQFIQRATSYMSKMEFYSYPGFAMYYIFGVVAFIVGYLCITNRIKNSTIGIILLATIGGGFFFNFMSSSLQTMYRAFRSDHLYAYGLSYKEAVIMIIKYPLNVVIFLALIILQIKVDKDKKETD